MEYDDSSYHTNISKERSQEQAPETLKRLLYKMSLDEHSLPSILIGNIVTSVITKRPTPLQVALGVYFPGKKTIKHIYDYRVSCSYDEVKRFKRSSAWANYLQINNIEQIPHNGGVVQFVHDNFDAKVFYLQVLSNWICLTTVQSVWRT